MVRVLGRVWLVAAVLVALLTLRQASTPAGAGVQGVLDGQHWEQVVVGERPPTPYAAAVDAAGNLWQSHDGGVDRISPSGAVTHVTSTEVGGLVAVGDEMWGYSRDEVVRRIAPDGTLTVVTTVDTPWHRQPVVADPNGGFVTTAPFLSDHLERVAADGTVTHLAFGRPVVRIQPVGDTVWLELGDAPNRPQLGRLARDDTVTLLVTDGVTPRHLFAGADGDLWFLDAGAPGVIDRIGGDGTVTTVVDTGDVDLLPLGPTSDGAVWLTDGTDRLRVDAAGVVTRSPMPAAIGEDDLVVPGTAGDVWTVTATPRVLRLADDGHVTTVRPAVDEPSDLTLGADGNLWYVNGNGDDPSSIGRITPTGAAVAFGPEATPGRPAIDPIDLVLGPDGQVWFANRGPAGLGRIAPDGTVVLDDDPQLVGARELVRGPGGDIWFIRGASIGRVTAAGAVTLFPAAVEGAAPAAKSLVLGGDGNLWYADGPKIGRLTPAGVVTRFSPDVWGEPAGLVTAADGSIWFLQGIQSLGRITPQGAITIVGTTMSPELLRPDPDGRIWVWRRPEGWIAAYDPARHAFDFTSKDGYGIPGPQGTIWNADDHRDIDVRSPSGPRNVRAVAGNHQLTVSWDPPAVPNGAILGYDVASWQGPSCTTTTATSCTITGLANDVTYQFSVVARHVAASSPPAWTEPTWPRRYPDVDPSVSPFAWDIEWMAAEGITTGYPDGTFRPGLPVERQAMAAFLSRADAPGATRPACSTAPFTDVAPSAPFCAEIRWMKDQGITTGFPDGSFHPNATVERQAMAAFLSRAHAPAATRPPCTSAPFTDIAPTAPFCAEIQWMKTTGISTGNADGTYRPNDQVTRQAMAAFLHRLHDLGAEP